MSTDKTDSKNIYESDEYLENNPDWHTEDSAWKAEKIRQILEKNSIEVDSVCEVGCGAGQILHELQQTGLCPDATWTGYDIAPRAIELAQTIDNPKLNFECRDLLAPDNEDFFDLLLMIDVFEHVRDYFGFLEKCREKATLKVYHIPLEIHVSAVLRNQVTRERYSVGHIHYFNSSSAIASLKDTGHEIVDWTYTAGCTELYRIHPTFKRALANVPRWLFSRFSTGFAARMFGGYSLLVLAK
ncbi:MAG: class I SAM-dependent methyltransferase [Pirellulaceae bacterium]